MPMSPQYGATMAKQWRQNGYTKWHHNGAIGIDRANIGTIDAIDQNLTQGRLA